MFRNELLTQFRRRRTMALLGVLAIIPVIIVVALALSSSSPSAGEGPPFIDQITKNGYFAALTGLATALSFFLPLTIAIVSGDTIAGEAGGGTLRYLLIRPVSRLKVLLTKYAVTLVFALAATVIVVVAGLVAGGLAFGFDDVVSLSGSQISLIGGIERALLAAAVVASSMAGLAAIGLCISTYTEQAVGAMASAFAIWVISSILDSIPQIRGIHPALFTHYWPAFVDVLRSPMDFSLIGRGLLLQFAWVAIFVSAAWARFTTRDVLA